MIAKADAASMSQSLLCWMSARERSARALPHRRGAVSIPVVLDERPGAWFWERDSNSLGVSIPVVLDERPGVCRHTRSKTVYIVSIPVVLDERPGGDPHGAPPIAVRTSQSLLCWMSARERGGAHAELTTMTTSQSLLCWMSARENLRPSVTGNSIFS